MIAIIVALIGLVGVLLTIIADGVLSTRREKRHHDSEVKSASRLVCFELRRALAAAHICVEKKHWWSADVQLTTEAWQKYQSLLALELSDNNWRAVAIAFEAVDNLRTIGAYRLVLGANQQITDSTAEQIAPVRRDIMRGMEALGFQDDSRQSPSSLQSSSASQ
jgi:hypothetical protein